MCGVTLQPESELDRTSAGGQRHQSWPSLCTIPLRLQSHPSLLLRSWRRSPPPPPCFLLLHSPPFLLACSPCRSSSHFLPIPASFTLHRLSTSLAGISSVTPMHKDVCVTPIVAASTSFLSFFCPMILPPHLLAIPSKSLSWNSSRLDDTSWNNCVSA